MGNLSESSKVKLTTCHPLIQQLICEVAVHYDCTVLEGHRSEAEQNEAYETGHSKLQWPNGKHNSFPSKAVDVAPTPLDWQDVKRFAHFAGYVQATADRLGIKIRWGGNFDGDLNFKNDKFVDLVHFEILEESA